MFNFGITPTIYILISNGLVLRLNPFRIFENIRFPLYQLLKNLLFGLCIKGVFTRLKIADSV